MKGSPPPPCWTMRGHRHSNDIDSGKAFLSSSFSPPSESAARSSSSPSKSHKTTCRWNRNKIPMTMTTPILLLATLLLGTAFGDNAKNPSLDKPFQSSFERLPHVPCVSLFHRNGRVGCGTLGRSTMTGRLLHWSAVVDAEGDGNRFLKGLTEVPPYVVVMDERDYNNDNVDKIVSFAVSATEVGDSGYDDGNKAGAGVLRGILVLNSTAVDEVSAASSSAGTSYSTERRGLEDGYYYSPEPQSPQGQDTPSEQLSVGVNHAWNAYGDGLTNRDMYGIPTAYIADDSVASYLYSVALEQTNELSKKSENGKQLDEDDLFPTIVAEYNYYMGPDNQNSKSCLSWVDTDGVWRPKCLPLGGNSVWGVAGGDDSNAANNNGNSKPIVMLATSIDSTSMFHDASPGASTAASNILALLMAAKLIGSSVTPSTLDGLSKRIAFGFFQGESYGYIGSRSFFRDVAYPGFQCDENHEVAAVAKDADGDRACLNPLRPSLSFRDVNNIVGMISVDQVGVLQKDKYLYVHGGENVAENDDGTSAFLAEVLASLSTNDYTVSAAGEQDNGGNDNDDDEYPLPPSPLTSLVKLSEGAVGGAVLAGYDNTFAAGSLYHSHLDSNQTRPVSMESIAASATILARAAVASAYDGGDEDAETSATYASNLIPDLDPADESLLELANCLLTDGNCELLLNNGIMERQNAQQKTGVNLGLGVALGTPPNYYISVFDASNGQSFVQVGDEWYSSYTKDNIEYGKKDTDTFLTRPSLLETGIYGLLNNYLGQSDASSGEKDGRRLDDGSSLLKCSSTKDCSSASYCTTSSSSSNAVCAGGSCVCPRAHYHLALDESIQAAPNNSTGRFVVKDDDEGISAMFTEPYWSNSIGVKVYRDAGKMAGNWALGAGLVVAAIAVASTWCLKSKLKKEKLY